MYYLETKISQITVSLNTTVYSFLTFPRYYFHLEIFVTSITTSTTTYHRTLLPLQTPTYLSEKGWLTPGIWGLGQLRRKLSVSGRRIRCKISTINAALLPRILSTKMIMPPRMTPGPKQLE